MGIEDFRTSATGGSDFDVLKFNNLTFDSDATGAFDINIFSLASDGTAGAVTNSNGVAGLWDDATLSQGGLGVYKGFKFLDGSGTGDSGITWGAKLQSTVQLLMALHPVQSMMDSLVSIMMDFLITITFIMVIGAFTMIIQAMISTCNSQLYLNRAPMLWLQVSYVSWNELV